MKVILILVLILLSSTTWARVVIEVQPQKTIFNQGEILEAQIRLRDQATALDLSLLTGKNIGETIYFLEIDPVKSYAKIIFTKVPTTQQVMENFNGQEVTLIWPNVEVLPTQEPKSFLFGEFTIPTPLKILYWIMGAGLCLFLTFFILRWRKIRKEKKTVALKRKKLLQSLVSASSYPDLVNLWEQKKLYLQEFPQIEQAFLQFESTLFLYQFKAHRTQRELDEIDAAYRKLKDFIQQGGVHGI